MTFQEGGVGLFLAYYSGRITFTLLLLITFSLAPRGGNLNKLIYKSSNARGTGVARRGWRRGMLRLIEIDQCISIHTRA